MKKSSQLKAALKDILALEKTLKDQMNSLNASVAANGQAKQQASGTTKTTPAPFPAALGEYLLHRLTRLEAAADRLAFQAEKQGDHKSALKGIQVSVRLINAIVRLAAKNPHLAENWQPPTQEHRAGGITTPLISAPPEAMEVAHPFTPSFTALDASGPQVRGS